MPVLAYRHDTASGGAHQSLYGLGDYLLEVTEASRAAIMGLATYRDGLLDHRDIPVIRELLVAPPFDCELMELIGSIEAMGCVFVRLF